MYKNNRGYNTFELLIIITIMLLMAIVLLSKYIEIKVKFSTVIANYNFNTLKSTSNYCFYHYSIKPDSNYFIDSPEKLINHLSKKDKLCYQYNDSSIIFIQNGYKYLMKFKPANLKNPAIIEKTDKWPIK